jgi:hypothetical protein
MVIYQKQLSLSDFPCDKWYLLSNSHRQASDGRDSSNRRGRRFDVHALPQVIPQRAKVSITSSDIPMSSIDSPFLHSRQNDQLRPLALNVRSGRPVTCSSHGSAYDRMALTCNWQRGPIPRRRTSIHPTLSSNPAGVSNQSQSFGISIEPLGGDIYSVSLT